MALENAWPDPPPDRRTVMNVRLYTVSVLCLSLAAPAAAQSLDDKFWLEASIYDPGVNTTVRLQSKTSTAVATEIDLGSDLDL
jgi:hypothetical protein